MTPQDFTNWLRGLIEIAQPTKLNRKQTQIVKDHLQLVFKKETPLSDPVARERLNNLFNTKDPRHMDDKRGLPFLSSTDGITFHPNTIPYGEGDLDPPASC